MLLIDNFEQVTAQIETERGISKDIIVSAIEQALVSACRKKFPEDAELVATIDRMSGEARIFQVKTVVKKIENDALDILLKDAQSYEKKIKVEEELRIEVTPTDFGRIAAQTAKQVILQRIREAEKNLIFDEFSGKIGTIITGTVQRIETRNYLINLGRTEASLSFREQIPGEAFAVKDKVKLYLVDVETNPRGTYVHISRTHPGFLKKLFENEIPEIQDGIIEIVSVAREPGKRAKVAVKTNNPSIGAVGTCVGHMGGRIQTIIKELNYEKIDVLEWNEDPKVFISNSLKPAKIDQVVINDAEEKSATVIVASDQLSLAIGKNGINVRLSVKLTGWKLDILNNEEYKNKGSGDGPANGLSFVDKIKREKEKMDKEEAALAEKESEDSTPKETTSTKTEGTKVSVLAKELGLKTKELMEKAAEHGVEIKSNRSLLTDEQVATLREKVAV